jgi:hypothetical protein
MVLLTEPGGECSDSGELSCLCSNIGALTLVTIAAGAANLCWSPGVTTVAGFGAGALTQQHSLPFAGPSRTDSLGMQHWCVDEIVPAKHKAVGASSDTVTIAASNTRIETTRHISSSSIPALYAPSVIFITSTCQTKRAPRFAN